MSGKRNLVVRRGHPKAEHRIVLSSKACNPVSLRVRSPDVAVRSAVHISTKSLTSETEHDGVHPLMAPNDLFEPRTWAKKTIKLGASKRCSKNAISWEEDHVPSESQILQLANQPEPSFVLGFSALHWACELLQESVVRTIIDKKLVHPNTFALHKQFVCFTPVFSPISMLWLRAEHDSDIGVKDLKHSSREELACLSIMKILAAAGAKLDSEAIVHLHESKHVTLLHIAADYACLHQGRAFRYRKGFFLQVAQLLADNLTPSESAFLFEKKCKIYGGDAMTVKQLLESKSLPPKLKTSCIASLLSIFSLSPADESQNFHDAVSNLSSRDTVSAAPSITRRGRPAKLNQFLPQKKQLPRSRLRMNSDASSNVFSPLGHSDAVSMLQMSAMSSLSDSDSESGFVSGLEDASAQKRGCAVHASSSNRALNSTSSIVASQDCEIFLASCDRIHSQCKLGCVPGVGVEFAIQSPTCTSEVTCPFCGNHVYSSLVNPVASTVHDMQASMSIHVIKECTGFPCSIDCCGWKGAYSLLPYHIATSHTFTPACGV